MKEEQDLISIIIPVFNVEKYLDRCITSVMQQTYPHIEVLVIDDGSSDNSRKICDEWGEKDKRIRVFHKRNGGAASARNLGLMQAKGNYIGFVDSDDFIEPEMYENMLAAMTEGVDLVSCGTILEYPRQMRMHNELLYLPVQKTEKKYTGISALEELLLLRAFSFSACDKLFRKELLKGIKFPVGRSSEDLPMIFDTFLKCRNIVNTGNVKYHYIYRADSNSKQEFFFRRVDYAVFAGYICREITDRYPQLTKQAQGLYIKCLGHTISGIKSCRNRNDYIKLEKRLKKAFLKIFITNYYNPYISEQEKQWLIDNVFWR